MASSDDDRQREINMFAAMALGTVPGGDAPFRSSSPVTAVEENNEHPTQESSSTMATGASDEQSAFQSMFAAAQLDVDSGTFAMSSTSKSSSVTEQSNLEAAVAALTGRDEMVEGPIASPSFAALEQDIPTRAKAGVEDIPMYSEEVRMPRPLFFGAILPPRVLREAQQIVQDSVEELQHENQALRNSNRNNHDHGNGMSFDNNNKNYTNYNDNNNGDNHNNQGIRLTSLPPEVKNLVGTIRAFGHGLSVFEGQLPCENGKKEKNDKLEYQGKLDLEQEEFWKGSSYVSTFQPVFGNHAKLRRKKRRSLPEEHGTSGVTQDNFHPGTDTSPPDKFSGQEPTSSLASNESDDSIKQETNSFQSATPVTKQNPENDLFLMWARGAGEVDTLAGNSTGSLGSRKSNESSDFRPEQDKNPTVISPDGSGEVTQPMSDQDLFSLWARGESPLATSKGSVSIQRNGRNSIILDKEELTGTFQRLPTSGDDSDDDSVIGSELKKKVGVNEHLDKALASLVDDGGPSAEAENMPDTQALLSQQAAGGRPLTNLELTCGSVPLFGVDDSPLPVEGDLGIHETKEEQQRFFEQSRSQEIIEKHVGPNVFGPMACPNPAISPSDNHSWNSRAALSLRSSVGSHLQTDRVGGVTSGPVSPRRVASSRDSASASTHRKKRKNSPKSQQNAKGVTSGKRQGRHHSRSRYGWWNVTDESENATEKQDQTNIYGENASAADSTSPNTAGSSDTQLQLPPVYHSSTGLLVETNLTPTPEQLREENLPLSFLHAGTSMAQSLPYLSDRPPSYRYLQIDARAVGFTPLGGEVEPLFCSLAVYNVETVSTMGKDTNGIPTPDLERCGRVTEVLNFDVVSDPEVERRCEDSLWPGFGESSWCTRTHSIETKRAEETVSSGDKEGQRLQGTSCGVFPLPSNLNLANLYAVLVVQKVLSEESDFEIYLKKGKSFDMNKFRSKAEKSSNLCGNFLMPFAFGVAPLIQVFGTDTPVVASSRAVQIPLFRFSAGLGERQIIDHIMVMLYPRADFARNGIGGPAPVTNGGDAMLVMRNFGYLGLHSIVHSRSSLAKDRVVDFTGELQIRRKTEDDPNEDTTTYKENVDSIPPWHKDFVAEPAVYGGRNSVSVVAKVSSPCTEAGLDLASPQTSWGDDPSVSPFYAQELAPVPLQLTPSQAGLNAPRRTINPAHSGDAEPFFHTSFCNELLCHPRILHNCPKGNIVMKVEFREMEWKQDYNAYFAHIPRDGPSVHNPRRGPFLVQAAFTSCAVRNSDPHFLDEFKLKLPLQLKTRKGLAATRTLSLFFSVYHVRLSSRRMWKKRITLGQKKGLRKGDSAESSDIESVEDRDPAGKTKLELLSCGFLPITTESCLIGNGLHDVRMIYTARAGPREGTLIVSEKGESATASLSRESRKSSSFVDREDEQVGSRQVETDEESESMHSDTVSRSDQCSRSENQFYPKSVQEQMSLQVRVVVHSSLHTQNATLCDFLQHEPDLPLQLDPLNEKLNSMLRLDRDTLTHQLGMGVSPKQRDDGEKMFPKSIVNISNMNICSLADVLRHLLRIMPILWRLVVAGTSEPDLFWSNPAARMPLRVHAFESLIQVIGAASLHMAKNGVLQMDGISKWDVVTMGRILALVFDEQSLFGPQSEEIFEDDVWMTQVKEKISISKSSVEPEAGLRHGTDSSVESVSNEQLPHPNAKKKKRHVRSNSDLFNDMSTWEDNMGTPDEDLLAALDALNPGLSPRSGDNKGNDFQLKSRTIQGITTSTSLPLSSAADRHPQTNKLLASDRGFKIDSKADFMNAMEAGLSDIGYDKPVEKSGLASMVEAFSCSTAMGSRRFMTAPHPALAPPLATIQESDEIDDGDAIHSEEKIDSILPDMQVTESLDSELVLKNKRSVKQMRVPKLKRASSSSGEKQLEHEKNTKDSQEMTSGRTIETVASMFADEVGERSRTFKLLTKSDDEIQTSSTIETIASMFSEESEEKSQTLPKSDDEIVSAATAFLDEIGKKNQSLDSVENSDDGIEEAGNAFLDVIGKELRISPDGNGRNIGEERRVGQAHHRKTRSRSSIDWTLNLDEKADGFRDLDQSKSTLQNTFINENESTKDTNVENDESMLFLSKEFENTFKLPCYVDRLITLGRHLGSSGRWFPYAYEVVIMQFVASLSKQRSAGDKTSEKHDRERKYDSAAAFASTPVLLEIIKQSLGRRIRSLFLKLKSKAGHDDFVNSPLVILDDTMLENLEQLISIVTDACIDSRSFDTPYLRQMSIDINDSVISFLRDLFGFLSPSCVHRLLIVYTSRFVITKEGKQRQDSDSNLGAKYPHEVTKLRLNAVTALIRFPDFIRVNSPLMLNYPSQVTNGFFDNILDRFERLQLTGFVDGDSDFELPSMRPHWLSEIVVEICLSGTGHIEPHIQHRASSLLYELFWATSQQGMADGNASHIASMFITFLEKVLRRSLHFLSNFHPRNQLRKDILPCVIFILQCAPPGLLRAQWRRLCTCLAGKGDYDRIDRYGGIRMSPFAEESNVRESLPNPPLYSQGEPDALDMFMLLNMALSTIEYEGSDDLLETDSSGDSNGHLALWRKEFLPALSKEKVHPFLGRKQKIGRGKTMQRDEEQKIGHGKTMQRDEEDDISYDSSSSRKWHAHDGSMVIVTAGHQIVWEMYSLLSLSTEGQSLLNPSRRRAKGENQNTEPGNRQTKDVRFSYLDVVILVRAATSLYLHALALRSSDIVLVKALRVSTELVKIFGIKIFLEGVGETLQHWMRVALLHCGARRASVRVEATDFLELVLRSTWESYGSFFRIRLPLLAVYSEVMERIVKTATSRYYREERRLKTTLDNFSNASAEASLAPLWRTLDRLHLQSASQNIAFKGALIRLAEKLKKLYRAYIARRAVQDLLFFGARSPGCTYPDTGNTSNRNPDSDVFVRACRITILRVINASAAYSKQFLGFHGTTLQRSNVAHFEAVEDAFLDAADVFSPTELPEHRVAWLRMLAEFHAKRKKYAEEATCHFHIHATLQQAASLHGSLWSNTPFLPWTQSIADPVDLDGETPSGDAIDYGSDFDFDGTPGGYYGIQVDDANSSRRIFYRVANSVRANTEYWEKGLSRTLFCGVTFAADYCTVSPWTTRREMEESMVEEAEAAGHLFLRSGIIESSRFAWNLATQYYSEKFNYGKLAHVYGCLAGAVVSRVPPIDASQQQEVSISLGRFYRVWFHGGAPDELIGAEFVYRTASHVRLEQFGDELRDVIKCIIPDKTPIHLVLDGRPEEAAQPNYAGGFSRIGPAPLEPVKIKVTPLRPLFEKASKIRGLPEWFNRYIDEAFSNRHHSHSENRAGSRNGTASGKSSAPGHRAHSRSLSGASSSIFSSGSSTGGQLFARRINLSKVSDGNRGLGAIAAMESELVGVDKFCFLQPMHKDRVRGIRDWWKTSSGDFAEKSLKVTQLQVGKSFPACVARQAVVHRFVYTQSPLEAGVDAVCQWCSVLFRTAVATNGMAVLGNNSDLGIGKDAGKVVADCIHSSRVKEMGLALLKKNSDVSEEENNSDILMNYDRLMEDEMKKLQAKLARAIVVFMELLHLLIARNRDLLLHVIQERKKEGNSSYNAAGGSIPARSTTVPVMPSGSHRVTRSYDGYQHDDLSNRITSKMKEKGSGFLGDEQPPQPPVGLFKEKPDAAIAVQVELQRSFIALSKALHPMILGIIQAETPRWLKNCCNETYFSMSTYRQTRIPIAEELCFSAGENFQQTRPISIQKTEQVGSVPLAPLASPVNIDYGIENQGRHQLESPAGSGGGSSVYSENTRYGIKLEL